MSTDRDLPEPGTPKNLPASLRARLLTRAKELDEDYQRVLNRFAMERFLYRLGASELRDRLHHLGDVGAERVTAVAAHQGAGDGGRPCERLHGPRQARDPITKPRVKIIISHRSAFRNRLD